MMTISTDNTTSVQHLGIVMDGNRRWAKEHNLPAFAGHKRGVDTLENVGDWCLEHGIKYLTVWAFSTENWDRPKDEVSFLMKLLKEVAVSKVKVFMKKGVRLQVLGRIRELPKETREAIEKAIETTKQNSKVIMNIAINYGGRAEIIDAIKKIVSSGIKSEEITEEKISDFMYNPNLPEPELVIRTGGAERSSGFLLWETPYSEWYYSQKKWPEFDKKEFENALDDFKGRKRNFGK